MYYSSSIQHGGIRIVWAKKNWTQKIDKNLHANATCLQLLNNK